MIAAKILTWVIIVIQVITFFKWRNWRPIGIHRNGALLARIRFGIASVVVLTILAEVDPETYIDEKVLILALLMLGNYTDPYMYKILRRL